MSAEHDPRAGGQLSANMISADGWKILYGYISEDMWPPPTWPVAHWSNATAPYDANGGAPGVANCSAGCLYVSAAD